MGGGRAIALVRFGESVNQTDKYIAKCGIERGKRSVRGARNWLDINLMAGERLSDCA